MKVTMGHELSELLGILRGLGVVAALVAAIFSFLSIIAAGITWIVHVRVKGFANVAAVKKLTEAFEDMSAKLDEVVNSQVSIRLELGRQTEHVTRMNDLTGDLLNKVGEYTVSSEKERDKLDARIREVEKEGCPFGRARLGASRPGNGGVKE